MHWQSQRTGGDTPIAREAMTKRADWSPPIKGKWPEDLDNYSIYPIRDRIRPDSLNFILDNYGDHGVFNEDQIKKLSRNHGLSVEQVQELSRLLGYCLDIDTEISFVAVSRSTVYHRLQNRHLGKRNRDRQLTASEANALFSSFGINAIVDEKPEPSVPNSKPVEKRKKGADGRTILTLRQAQRLLQPDDRSNERDRRRLLVVESCCYVGLDAGWGLTFTTDSSRLKNQRCGRIINLIEEVIPMVTHNAQKVSGHTLKDDLELVKRRFERRGDIVAR